MSEFGDVVSNLCLNHFKSLPKHGKPEVGRQWTVLAAFVQEQDKKLNVVALGTGTTCLGSTQMCASGRLVHDSHAEVIAQRAFKRYLFDQILKTFDGASSTIFNANSDCGTCKLNPNVSFHFYSTQSPCGDASIYSIDNFNADQIGSSLHCKFIKKRKISLEEEGHCNKICKTSKCAVKNVTDPSDHELFFAKDINRTGAKCAPGEKNDSLESGDAYHEIGVLRTKPGRGIRTHSMSCSDKLMKWNIMGCQGALISHFLEDPIYISTFVIYGGPSELAALKRALVDRVDVNLLQQLVHSTPYRLNSSSSFRVSNVSFEFSKTVSPHAIPCGSSVVWSLTSNSRHEVIAKNGLKIGFTKKHQNLPTAVAAISRVRLFEDFKQVVAKLPQNSTFFQTLPPILTCKTYRDFKLLSHKYCEAWNVILKSLFANWVKHDRALDCFIEK